MHLVLAGLLNRRGWQAGARVRVGLELARELVPAGANDLRTAFADACRSKEVQLNELVTSWSR